MCQDWVKNSQEYVKKKSQCNRFIEHVPCTLPMCSRWSSFRTFRIYCGTLKILYHLQNTFKHQKNIIILNMYMHENVLKSVAFYGIGSILNILRACVLLSIACVYSFYSKWLLLVSHKVKLFSTSTAMHLELIPNLSGLTLIFLQVAYWNNDRGAT